MPTYNAANVNQLVSYLLSAQTATAQVIINLTASSYNLSTYTGIANIINNAQFGNGSLKSGLPHILKDVIVQAAPSITMATITRTNDTYKYRHFYIAPGAKLTLRNVQLTNGNVGTLDAGGGAVYNEGILDARNCKFGPNNNSNYGGAILNFRGQVDILNCDIYQNLADWGGGLYNYLPSNNCVMNITDSRIASNVANENHQNGGGIANFGMLNIQHCMITGNTGSHGGGIANWDAAAQVVIRSSHISTNTATTKGGGLYNNAGSMQVENSTLVANTAPAGAQAYKVAGTLSLTRVALPETPDNYATTYPAIVSSGITITNPLPSWRPDFTMVLDTSKNLIPVYNYNRQEAANFATALSRDNFVWNQTNQTGFPQLNSGVGSVVGRIQNGPTYPKVAGRNYSSVLSHVTLQSGSALFISEAIHRGGIPMTIDAGDDPLNPDCTDIDQTTTGPFSTRGWRACPSGNTATGNWKNHLGVKAYFDSFPTGDLIGTESGALNSNVDKAIYRDNLQGLFGGTLKSGSAANTARAAIIARFAAGGSLSTVNIGDYVFVDLAADDHGFIIVGWGPFLGTTDAITHALTNPLGTARSTTNPIPYVADFSFGTNGTDDGTGWYQDARPRPFYATATEVYGGGTRLRSDQVDNLRKFNITGLGLIPVYQRFDVNTWEFWRIPNTINVTVMPTNRLYFAG